jgi:undecaprenyl-diphosphatase
VRLLAAAALLWGALCGIGYLLGEPLHQTDFEDWDGATDRWLADHRGSGWNTVTHILTDCAETLTVVIVGAVCFVALRLLLGRWRASMFLVAALAGEVVIFVLTTLVVDRHRPRVPHLDDAPPTSSFPSGHTAAAVALYGSLAVIAVYAARRASLRVSAVAVAIILPICVAISRLYRGMHYPTDVLCGALLGAVWLLTAWAVILRRHDLRRREAPR